jgi:methylmalonyl-CoA/ethylmalonyl-CoA epimerase
MYEMIFHHIGVVCRNLERELRELAALGYSPESEPFVDPLQGIRGCFVTGPGPRLELLTPSGDSSPLSAWLDKGVKMYHQAFEVEHLAEGISTLTVGGGILVSPPKQAVAFNSREVAFVMLPNMLLVELISAR